MFSNFEVYSLTKTTHKLNFSFIIRGWHSLDTFGEWNNGFKKLSIGTKALMDSEEEVEIER